MLLIYNKFPESHVKEHIHSLHPEILYKQEPDCFFQDDHT